MPLFSPEATRKGEMAPSTLAQWFAAVGTISAVLWVLFKDSILWWRKPRLVAASGKEIPWTHRTPIEVRDLNNGTLLWHGHCYYVRATVRNSGGTRAEKVQVQASKLAKLGADDKFADIQTFLPLNMKWSNSPPGGAATTLDGISPGMAALCDLVSVCDPANPHQRRPAGLPPNTTVGQLQLEVAPLSNSDLLPPGTYRLTLRIAAANVQPIEKIFQFKHTGVWLQDDAEMLRDCLGVSLQ
jgi:hypothetical protein